jgi:hypothetical protein
VPAAGRESAGLPGKKTFAARRPRRGGLVLPGHFEALVVVDSLPGRARHLAVRDNGDILRKGPVRR